jgi:hypothetical protein
MASIYSQAYLVIRAANAHNSSEEFMASTAGPNDDSILIATFENEDKLNLGYLRL